jgi:hypothetical protein
VPTTTRKPATTVTVGDLVYKGQGTILYRVWTIAEGGEIALVKATTEGDPQRPAWFDIRELTVDVKPAKKPRRGTRARRRPRAAAS